MSVRRTAASAAPGPHTPWDQHSLERSALRVGALVWVGLSLLAAPAVGRAQSPAQPRPLPQAPIAPQPLPPGQPAAPPAAGQPAAAPAAGQPTAPPAAGQPTAAPAAGQPTAQPPSQQLQPLAPGPTTAPPPYTDSPAAPVPATPPYAQPLTPGPDAASGPPRDPTLPSATAPLGSGVKPEGASYGPSRRDEEPEQESPHRGLFGRFTVGPGIGHVGNGSLPPKPGFKPIPNLDHTSPVLGIAGQLGGGGKNFAVAAELFYEQMLSGIEPPSKVGFALLGLGATASYYTDLDIYLTGHLRWVGLFTWTTDVPCSCDPIEGRSGPGLGLTLGKEWFHHHEAPREDADPARNGAQPAQDRERRTERGPGGIGVALQANYARLSGSTNLEYLSGLLLLSVTRF